MRFRTDYITCYRNAINYNISYKIPYALIKKLYSRVISLSQIDHFNMNGRLLLDQVSIRWVKLGKVKVDLVQSCQVSRPSSRQVTEAVRRTTLTVYECVLVESSHSTTLLVLLVRDNSGGLLNSSIMAWLL